LKAWPILGISIVEIILLLAHWFLFHTWIEFWDAPSAIAIAALRAAMLLLACSFVVAALLSFRYANHFVAVLYKLAAVWLGLFNYLVWAACLSWLIWYAYLLLAPSHLDPPLLRPLIINALSVLALLAGIYGLLNARWIRTRRISVALPGLPASWRGRRAVLMSDLHLGHINGEAFSRRMVAMAAALQPDVVFIPGDLYDGTEADLDRLASPFKELRPPLGIYFSTGNHEEFGGLAQKLEAISRNGMRVLNNERVTVDGLHIAGVPFGDSTSPIRLRAVLDGLALDPDEASVLLNHMPSRLPLVEHAGVSLQLSGHTHGGQFFPFTWLTSRVFGRFTYGLHRFGALQVYTSTGAGTWGPPMRLGTNPEIVLIEFA
jgi:predicted MPP superfamily phosphohydrolase